MLPTSIVYAMPCLQKQIPVLIEENVIADICKAFNVSWEDVMSHNRKTKFKYARWFFWKILRSHGYSLAICGGYSGHDHTSVINGMRNIDRDIENIWELWYAWEKVKKHYNG